MLNDVTRVKYDKKKTKEKEKSDVIVVGSVEDLF